MENPLTIRDIVYFMNKKLQTDSCWSNFNQKYKYYQFLVEESKISSFYKPSDLPEEPKPSDNENLSC